MGYKISIENKSILFCSVEELVRMTIKKALELEGGKVYLSTNGLEAMEILKSESIDVLVTEEMLPYQSGLNLIKICDELNIPSIIISDSDLENKILQAFGLGAYDFIDKPYSPNELVVRTKNVLRLSMK